MKKSKQDKHVLKNGMVILGEPMETVESAAFGFMLPAGASVLPEGFCGAANVIEDWIFRGAGKRSNRELNDALDGMGVHRSSSTSSSHVTVGAALEASNLKDTLEIYADIILRPTLDQKQFELARQLAIDDVLSLDDDPHEKTMLKLQEQFYPYPLGRSITGEIEQLKALKADVPESLLKNILIFRKRFLHWPANIILTELYHRLEKLFDSPAAAAPKPSKQSRKIELYAYSK